MENACEVPMAIHLTPVKFKSKALTSKTLHPRNIGLFFLLEFDE